MDTVVFRSKVDAWLLATLVAFIVLAIAGAAIAVMAGGVAALVSAPLLLLTIGLVVWVLGTTDYTLSGSDLRIRSGPFGWRVPLADITSLTPTRNPLSSPALSLDRLRIEYGHRSIMISPEDREGFLGELDRRRPTSAG